MRYKFLLFPLLLLFLLGVYQDVSAAEWYVSQSGTGVRNGTSAQNAWAGWPAIQWASIRPGDTLYVIGLLRGGTGFSVSSSVNGTANSPITIAGYPQSPGVFYEGLEYSDSGWTSEGFGAYKRTVTNCNYEPVREWTSDPLNYRTLVKEGVPPDATWLPGSYYCEGAVGGILHYRPTDDNLSGKNLTAKWITVPSLYVSGDHVIFRELTFSHGVRVGGGDPAHHVVFDRCVIKGGGNAIGVVVNPNGTNPGSDFGIIRNCDISEATNGIYLINQGYDEANDNHGWTITGNKIHDITGSKDSHAIGIQGGNDHLIEKNELYNAGTGVTFWVQPSKIYFKSGSSAPAVGEMLTTSSGGRAVVAYSADYVQSGSWQGGDASGYINVNSISGAWVDGDLIIGSSGMRGVATGATTRQSLRNAVVRYNYIHNMVRIGEWGNGRGIEYSGDHSENELIAGGLVYGNIINNVSDACLRMKGTWGGNWKFFNNTLRDCKYGFYTLASNYVGNINPDFDFINNIVADLKPGGYHVNMTRAGADATRASFKNNLYWPDVSGANNRWRWNGSLASDFSFSYWKNLSGEANPILADPKFANGSGAFSAHSDFQLQPSSLAINAGTDVGLTSDYVGNPISGTPDIGAYEYQSASQAPTYSITDFLRLISDWLRSIASPADVNGDGIINARDLGVMMSGWE